MKISRNGRKWKGAKIVTLGGLENRKERVVEKEGEGESEVEVWGSQITESEGANGIASVCAIFSLFVYLLNRHQKRRFVQKPRSLSSRLAPFFFGSNDVSLLGPDASICDFN